MKAKKQTAKTKEPIKLRVKELANGNQSYYLDIYVNGVRRYEFLKLYKVRETTEFDKIQNKETERKAVAIKAARISELYAGTYNLTNRNISKKLLFVDWVAKCMSGKRATKTQKNYQVLINHLKAFDGKATILQVDEAYIEDFIEYLDGKDLSNNYKLLLLAYLRNCLNQAVAKELINKNPFAKVARSVMPKHTDVEKSYLTETELKELAAAYCGNDTVKKAFLFCCFTGLRFSDVKRLTAANIVTVDGVKSVKITMQKTGKVVTVPLSNQAANFLPQSVGGVDAVLFPLPSLVTVEKTLKNWAKAANIGKAVTFHTSRHTFGTLFLTLGADLYTVSEMLGHTNIKTTTIYAKIVDDAKVKAVNLANKISLEA